MEIDNRYQEYAPAHCPRMMGRHHGPLTGAESAGLMRRQRRLMMSRKGFLTGVGILILITVIMGSAFGKNSQEPGKTPTHHSSTVTPEPKPTPNPDPTPEPIPEPDPKPDPTPVPDPKPTPDPDPKPTPVPDPDPKPTPDPDPKPDPNPVPDPDPDPDPKPDPKPDPDPDPTPELVHPRFTDLGCEREIGPIIDDYGTDIFHYSFDIALEDADTNKPLSVRLQYGSMDGSGWQNCPEEGESVVTLNYSGSGTVWSGELAFDTDAFGPDWYEYDTGITRQIRIVCDYTLTDGTAGTIYSTDCGKLYAYEGDYVTDCADSEGYTGVFDNDGLHVTLRLLTHLIPDTSKARLTDLDIDAGVDPYCLFLIIGYDVYYVTADKVTMSAPGSDGTFTLFCPWDAILPEGTDPHPGDYDFITVSFNYYDKDTGFDWDCIGWGYIRTEEDQLPQFTSVSSFRNWNPGIDDWYIDTHYYTFNLDLGDADISKPVTARLQFADLGGSWTDCPGVGESVVSLTYSGSGGTWTSDGELAFDAFSYNYGNATGILKKVRVVVDFSMPDGSTGSVYSDDIGDLFAYTGDYLNLEYGTYSDNIITGYYWINTGLIPDMSGLELTQITLFSSNDSTAEYHYWDILDSATVSPIAGDGTFAVTYELNGETLDPDFHNTLLVAFEYNGYSGAIDRWQSSAEVILE